MGQILAKCLSDGSAQEGATQPAQSGRSQQHAHSHGNIEVLFFPDGQLPCRNFMADGHCRFGNSCKYSHAETNLVKMLKRLRAAQRTVDICVFTITCDDISNTILDLHKAGKQIRIVTDNDQSNSRGSDVHRLAQAGVPVVADSSPAHMHHKFAIVDGSVLLSGSFNWTVSAVQDNQENIIVTDDPALVQPFAKCFEKLWRQFANNRIR